MLLLKRYGQRRRSLKLNWGFVTRIRDDQSSIQSLASLIVK